MRHSIGVFALGHMQTPDMYLYCVACTQAVITGVIIICAALAVCLTKHTAAVSIAASTVVAINMVCASYCYSPGLQRSFSG